ncbi:MAG: sulfite exporter TauE/SafE family protein, partial [Lentisphaeria bacterium]|nr:sulfite exporter TauE/SafE family protein [Lentisphaeria bacterium]NQZ69494.1 sulfite exporter TauE/SafE family protein [Lentisphaeria bacterium]
WVLVLIAACIVGYSKTGVAGVGILAPVMMADIFDARFSIGILLPMLIMADTFAVLYYRRHAEWKHVIKALPLAYLGIIMGFIILIIYGDTHGFAAVLKKIIGLIVIVILLLSIYQAKKKEKSESLESDDSEKVYKPDWWLAPFLGIVGGIATMLANAAGPIFIVYALALNLPKNSFIGTLAWIFFILNWSKIPFTIYLGYTNFDSLIFNFKLLPCIIIGAVLGIATVKHIPEKQFTLIIRVLTFLAAIKLFL